MSIRFDCKLNVYADANPKSRSPGLKYPVQLTEIPDNTIDANPKSRSPGLKFAKNISHMGFDSATQTPNPDRRD